MLAEQKWWYKGFPICKQVPDNNAPQSFIYSFHPRWLCSWIIRKIVFLKDKTADAIQKNCAIIYENHYNLQLCR